MIHAIESLSPLKVLVVALIGFCLGGLWYSPLLFVKAWLREMKITPEMIKAGAVGGPYTMPCAILFTIISTFALAALVAACNPPGALHGAAFGLFVGAGLVGARGAVNGIFEGRTLAHFLITSGHDVVLCTLQGAVLAVWR
jgi:Protein of unknown function (DUF1761)